MREGNLEAPTRHALAWRDEDFYDETKLDAEMRRAFDICHGCRRCFNLCDSFPRLFDLVDAAGDEEMHGVKSEDFKPVVQACTLCDMCFLTKCPYVPPHEFNLDFPHLMLRYRAVEHRKGEVPFTDSQIAETDRNGKLGAIVAPLANWATDTNNKLTRPIMEKVAGIHREAHLPKFHTKTLVARAKAETPQVAEVAPGAGRKAVIYATCFANYNNPDIGMAARAVLARNGVETEVVYPGCCGMPQLEEGDIGRVAEKAKNVAAELTQWVDKGYDVVCLVSSCALMMKFEWPLIEPQNADVAKLAKATYDICEYVVDVAKGKGLADGMQPVEGGVSLHLACHARAQNVGPKAAEMLRMIPSIDLAVIERCSGHGGSWGIRKDNFEVALKVGKPVARQVANGGKAHLASECPLAADHIAQGVERIDGATALPNPPLHPIQILAKAYGL
jgi:glycerol-3-phosphate dehydrogenase subunit C